LGFLAVAAVWLSTNPTQAAPYADIVVDANSGAVLHSTNPDALRHPASLTKIMTLYLLFEQLEAGKLKLDSDLKVSAEAAGQSPTKLGLKPGSTLKVEDAIKGMVTRSANDAAVVVAEAIAGDEDDFAQLMTRKAQSLGMSRTVYKNASGLPDDDQVTTARDQALLGRAIQERYPRYYKYFSTRSFNFRGQSIGNHNHLLGRVEGVDGIKTGYISASGFNLVTSVHRGNRYLLAVVLGGSSAGSRDARMRELIGDKIAQASTKRTAPAIAEGEPADRSVETRLAQAEAKPEAKKPAKPTAKAKPKPEPKPEPQAEADEETAESQDEPKFAVASISSTPAQLASAPAQSASAQPVSAPAQNPPAAAPKTTEQSAAKRTEHPAAAKRVEQPAIAAGSTDPIRPVLVKTLAVKAGGQTASVAALQAYKGASSAPVETAPSPVPPATAATAEPASEPLPVAAAPGSVPVRVAQAENVAAPIPPSTPVPAAQAAKAQTRSGWIIQVGAYHVEQEAKERLSAVQTKAAKVLTGADPFTEVFDKGGTTYYRARFAGLDRDKAEAACKYLKRNDVECVAIKN
jgi:D-alanyl-D-alanine carboxypeptidase